MVGTLRLRSLTISRLSKIVLDNYNLSDNLFHMKAKELQSLAANDGAYPWTVGGLVAVEDQNGTSIRTVSRITDGRGGTVYVQYKRADGTIREVAYDANGNLRGGNTWTRDHARPISEEQAQAIRNTNKSRRIASQLLKHDWYKVEQDKLLRLHETLVNDFGINLLEKKS